MNNEKWFLGGTCSKTKWRDELMPLLDKANIKYFNPVVKNWTPECQAIEEDEKNNKCNVHLYVITPEMKGIYSIAEIINSCWQAQVYGTKVNKVAVYFYGDWNEGLTKSIKATLKMCKFIAPNRFDGDIVHDTNNFTGIDCIIGGLERLDVLDNSKVAN